MSITAIDPSPAGSVPLRSHENLYGASAAQGTVPLEVRRFPVALRHGSASRTRRCTQPALTGESPPPRIPSSQEPKATGKTQPRRRPGTGSWERTPNPAAQAVAERLFPSNDDLRFPAASVAATVHAAAPAMLEVLAGARSARQLVRALSPECMLKLEYHVRLGAAQRPDPDSCCYSNPRVIAMRIIQVMPLVFEAAVVLRDMQKVRATALRIERWHGRWQVTALEIG